MPDIIADATNNTPEVIFRSNGDLSLSGRSLIIDVDSFYGPLCEWLKSLNTPYANIHIKFDYFNSSSSKKILEMLKNIDANNNIINFDVFWHFETNDEDILEIGQIFEERLQKAKFYFKEYAEA